MAGTETLKKGMSEQMKIDQKAPRSEVKGSQKPKINKQSVKGKGKSFTFA